MAIELVRDYPDPDALRGLREAVRGTIGVVLLTAAAMAGAPTLVLSFVALAWFGQLVDPEARLTDPEAQAAVGPLTMAWAILGTIAILGTVVGLRLVRGRRSLVLFLRRFGHTEATQAVTFAAARALGRSWRLVTLDDASIAPLGVQVATVRVLRLVRLVDRGVALGVKLVERGAVVVKLAVVGLVAILGLDALSTDLPEGLLTVLVGRVEQVVEVVENGGPVKPLGLDIDSAFLVIVAALGFTIAGVILAIPVMLLAIPLLVPYQYIESSLQAARNAEATKRRVIATSDQLAAQVGSLHATSRGVFAPRLAVLRVATPIWREVVIRLADLSSAIVIDVSAPSENLLWEVRELRRDLGSRFILVGEEERLRAWIAEASRGTVDPRLAALDGEKVLVYGTDPASRRRFARALRNRLVAVAGRA